MLGFGHCNGFVWVRQFLLYAVDQHSLTDAIHLYSHQIRWLFGTNRRRYAIGRIRNICKDLCRLTPPHHLDIFNNFPLPTEISDPNDLATAKAINVARGILCGVMFFVFPLESFVARHVIMTNLFRGRDAHEGDDHAVLDRWDRRVTTTIILFLSVLIPALHFSDVGLVLAFTGTVAATSLTYLLPGLLFIGVHGDEFLDLIESKWGCACFTLEDSITWYMFLIPVWCEVAKIGKKCLAFHKEKKALQTPVQTFRLGKIIHKTSGTKQQRKSSENVFDETSPMIKAGNNPVRGINPTEMSAQYGSIRSSAEDDPQDERQTIADFVVAVGFIVFGMVALFSGILSIVWSLQLS